MVCGLVGVRVWTSFSTCPYFVARITRTEAPPREAPARNQPNETARTTAEGLKSSSTFTVRELLTLQLSEPY
jgi:hypothetical protein